MRLENILALTKGELLSAPFVEVYENAAFRVDKVARGSLFVAYDINDIPQAIENGAYAIIFDYDVVVSDDEIAWIRVENLEKAIIKILRFYLLEKDLDVYACDPITLRLSTMIQTAPNFHNCIGTIAEIFNPLLNLEKKSIVLFSPAINDSEIFATYSPLIRAQEKSIHLIEQTLFETSFIHNDIFYERQILSPFFIPYLEHILYFYTFLRIPYTITSFKKMDHFIPVFINSRLEEVDFGTSSRVVIFEPLLEIIDEQRDFLDTQASWAKIIYIVPDSKKSSITLGMENIIFYSYKEEILSLLHSYDFHFALVAGATKEILNPSRADMKQLELEF